MSCRVPSASTVTPDSVIVLDGALELFVLVGSEARARRTDILLAVHVAISIATAVDARRPFTPTVHILVLPSQLPLDLKAGHFRFLSDEHAVCPSRCDFSWYMLLTSGRRTRTRCHLI